MTRGAGVLGDQESVDAGRRRRDAGRGENGQHPDTVALAQDIITAQEAEIAEMEQMLEGSWL